MWRYVFYGPDENSLLTQAKTIRYCLALNSSSDAVKENVNAVQLQTLYNQHNEMASEVQDNRRHTFTGKECFGEKKVSAVIWPKLSVRGKKSVVGVACVSNNTVGTLDWTSFSSNAVTSVLTCLLVLTSSMTNWTIYCRQQLHFATVYQRFGRTVRMWRTLAKRSPRRLPQA